MDKKAIKILLSTYWDSGGWKNGEISEEDQKYAIEQGVMFKPINYSHEETLESIRSLICNIKINNAAAAFLYSLSTRNLEYRSILGSYIYGKSIPDHKCTDKNYCNICGYNNLEYHEHNRTLDVFNFERFKWGGVRHDSASYALLDLVEFKKLLSVTPSADDIKIFNRIIEVAKSLSHGGPRELEKAISLELPSNKSEREILIGILGLCGILQTEKHQGYLNTFTSKYHRDPPPVGKANDWAYPVSWWKAQNGINEDALKVVFGDYL